MVQSLPALSNRCIVWRVVLRKVVLIIKSRAKSHAVGAIRARSDRKRACNMTTSSAGLSGLQFRLSHFYWYFVVLIAASLLALVQPAAWAQQSAPLDPPGRVARLNLTEGAVSFAPADGNAWTSAVLNRPLTSGDRLWTGPRARSELHVGSTALRMNEQTSLDFLTLDDDVVQLRLAQGTLQLRVRALFEGQRLEVDTPNLAFVISEPGNYRLDVNPASDSTRVVVQSGGGVIYGDSGAAVNLGSQQQASYTGTQLTPAAPGAAWQDSFDHWAAERDRREDQSVSARDIPRETIGYLQLDAYGDWFQDPGYGAVWLPRAVPVNWAPYRMGHWDWIAPWGWTWIDDAPWGFAPFHYGRWAQIGPRWAWVPGRLAARPVYAPALVAFVGGNSGGLNWSISIGSGGLARPSLGWFPLAPGEAFRPHYRVSPRYINQVNQNIVVNSAVNVSNVYRYQRQPAAVTAVSRDDFTRGHPVRGNQHLLSTAELDRAQVVVEHSAIPQRPDVRERPRPVAPAALPPATVITRPVVGRRDERRDDRRNENRDTRRPDARPGPAMPPALHPVPAPAPDRSAIDAEQRARREQQPLQRDQQRQQRELRRQPPRDQQRQQSEALPEQRALREPVQNNGNARPVMPASQAAAERNSALQAERAQQQLQRDQQRQQTELVRQQEQQRRQSEEALGQRALREQAQKQQEQARQQQAQQQQQRAQQNQQRQGQAAQAQKQTQQQDQQRQAREQQQQQRTQHDQQRQARELQQQQQLEQRKEQVQERKKARQADAANARPPRPEGAPIRNREQ